MKYTDSIDDKIVNEVDQLDEQLDKWFLQHSKSVFTLWQILNQWNGAWSDSPLLCIIYSNIHDLETVTAVGLDAELFAVAKENRVHSE